MYFVYFGLLAREYASREWKYNRGKFIEIHRDWMKTWNFDVFCLFWPACAGVYCEGERVESREIN